MALSVLVGSGGAERPASRQARHLGHPQLRQHQRIEPMPWVTRLAGNVCAVLRLHGEAPRVRNKNWERN